MLIWFIIRDAIKRLNEIIPDVFKAYIEQPDSIPILYILIKPNQTHEVNTAPESTLLNLSTNRIQSLQNQN